MMKASEREFRLAEWQIIPARRTLVSDGREVTPRAKVFELLLYLIERRSRVVTKEELLQELWGGRAIADNSLAQCLIELRKILGDDARQPRFIQTIPRSGYRLIAAVEETVPETTAAMDPAPEPGFGKPLTYALPEARATTARPKLWRLLWLAVPVIAVAALFAYLPLSGPLAPTFREVAWWKLDDRDRKVRDDSGNGQHGEAGRAVEWTSGRSGGAARMLGLGGGIHGSGNGSLPGGSTPRTISLWVQTSPPFIDFVTLFEYGSDFRGQTLERFGLYLTFEARVRYGPSVNHGWVDTKTRIDDGKWHLVTASWHGPESNKASIFLDGLLAAEGPMRKPETKERTEWRIGEMLWGQSTMRGLIDDVRVYNIALNRQQASALYRCSAGIRDYEEFYFMPVGYPTEEISPPAVRNVGRDYTGIQLARPEPGCPLRSLHGADMGQNLRMEVEVKVPTDSEARVTSAGPYFRSRRAAPGDGVFGGTSAGYWVQLHSNGMVKVKRMNPMEVVAFTPPDRGFDPDAFHRLAVEARGENLQVWLDGKLLDFQQGGAKSANVAIPPMWEGPPRLGKNDGTAGVFFGAEDNRWLIGGQVARNLKIRRLD